MAGESTPAARATARVGLVRAGAVVGVVAGVIATVMAGYALEMSIAAGSAAGAAVGAVTGEAAGARAGATAGATAGAGSIAGAITAGTIATAWAITRGGVTGESIATAVVAVMLVAVVAVAGAAAGARAGAGAGAGAITAWALATAWAVAAGGVTGESIAAAVIKVVVAATLVAVVAAAVTVVVAGAGTLIVVAVAALILFAAKRGSEIRFASVWMSRGITTLAVWLAGPRRTDLHPEWDGHLSALPGWAALRTALGFVVAAICLRLQDATVLAWRPVDYILGSDVLSAVVVLLSSLGCMARFFHHGGVCAVVLNALQTVGSWIAAVALIVAGRRYRGVEPLRRESRRGGR